jgi:hypothetical protein
MQRNFVSFKNYKEYVTDYHLLYQSLIVSILSYPHLIATSEPANFFRNFARVLFTHNLNILSEYPQFILSIQHHFKERCKYTTYNLYMQVEGEI